VDELTYLTIAQLADSYSRKTLSPVEVIDATFERITRLDSQLHTFITITPDAARLAAAASERRFMDGVPLGPLDGVPIGLKDLFDTAGVRTTAHSALLAERVPVRDATAVRLLRMSGAVLVGKHSMYEFASGRPETDAIFPGARNPWDTTRIPGGSSSGSAAAVASGLCAGALGSDTGGSIRLPSAYCGVVGMKPTYGLISRNGVLPLSWTLDHAGPIARTAEDARLLLTAVAGYDRADPASAKAGWASETHLSHDRKLELTVGTARGLVESTAEMDPDIARAYIGALEVFEDLGASLVEVEMSQILEHAAITQLTIMITEALSIHLRSAREQPERFGRQVYARLLEAAQLTALDYVDAQRGRSRIRAEMDRVMRAVDIAVLPTTVATAWRFEDDNDLIPQKVRSYFTPVFNLTGQPAVTVPCGFAANGLPIGLQIAGRPFEDHRALLTASAYERATGWSGLHPNLEF
jgi:aspartyl-tRNA(Asn)/glutamyl-tRNA(Gln) amidotransferase subunit A